MTVLGYRLSPIKGYAVHATEQKKQHIHRTSKKGRVFDYTIPYDKEVRYQRTIDGCTVSLSFEAVIADQDVTRRTVVNGVQLGKKAISTMARSLNKPSSVLANTEGDKIFDGMPGYFVNSTETFRDKDNAPTQSRDRTLYFWKKTHLYKASFSITGPSITAAVKSAGEKDWKMLLQTLQNQ